MSSKPSFVIPPGMKLVPDGQLSHHVTFRVDADLGEFLLSFRDTFQPAQWATSFRWLLAHPEVREIMRQRIEESLRSAS